MRWVVMMAAICCCWFEEMQAASPASESPETFTNSIGGKFRLVSAGKLTIGEGKDAYEIVVAEPFYLGLTEVTNGEATALMGFVPSDKKEPLAPVESLTWEEATRFCEILSARPQEQRAKRVYRLPTSDEWEFACRAGTTSKHFFGDEAIGKIGFFAWTQDNSGGRTHFVGQKLPNPWGFYDFYGNVWEFCSNQTRGGAAAIARGGSFNDQQLPHSGRKIDFGTTNRRNDRGFRIAVSVTKN